MVYRAIVTVQRHGEAAARDLEVPAEVSADRLAALIASALGWDAEGEDRLVVFQIEARSIGRRLANDETLASANAWDGSWLVLHPIAVERRPFIREPLHIPEGLARSVPPPIPTSGGTGPPPVGSPVPQAPREPARPVAAPPPASPGWTYSPPPPTRESRDQPRHRPATPGAAGPIRGWRSIHPDGADGDADPGAGGPPRLRPGREGPLKRWRQIFPGPGEDARETGAGKEDDDGTPGDGRPQV